MKWFDQVIVTSPNCYALAANGMLNKEDVFVDVEKYMVLFE